MDTEKVGALVEAVSQGRISRRVFLRAAVGLGVSLPAAMGLLQACAPAPTAAPTTVPGVTPSPVRTAAPTKTSAVIGINSAPRGMDPMYYSSDQDFPLMLSVYDSLFDMDYETMQLKPVLVEDWDQVDDLTLAFKLKEGVQFHKGYGEMTAEDYTWMLNKIIAEKSSLYFLMGSGIVTEAVVTDKYSFEIHLNQPWAAFPFLSLYTIGGIVLCSKAYEEMGREQFAINPIGTGPFELESWTPGGEVVLKKFEDYWDPGLPKLEKLTFLGIEDRVVRLEKILAGEINWTYALDMKDLAALRQDPNVQVVEGGGWNWDYMSFNLKETDKPWSDKRVRQAIAHAIDREAIVQSIYYGNAVPEDDSLPPHFLGSDPDQQFYPNTADVEKARALLAEAGYANGFTMPCLTSDKENIRKELQVVADQLSQIGITVQIEQSDSATFNTRWFALQFETYLEDAGMASSDSDSALYWWYHTSETGAINDGYSNLEVDDVLDRARRSGDPDERASLYRQVLELIAEDAPKIVICNVNEAYVLSAGLTGFYPSPLRMFPYFKTVYWSS